MFRRLRFGLTGFTLVEILVVLGVVGVLSTFLLVGSFASRAQTRDNRRLTDLQIVQQSLQLFYSKCGFYPGRYNPNPIGGGESRCLGGYLADDDDENQNNPNDWKELEETLKIAEIGSPNIPKDPLSASEYFYRVELGDQIDNDPPRAQCYVLGVPFETEHKYLKSDLDEEDVVGKKFFPNNPGCGFKDKDSVYCVGNLECFYKKS